jgi:hypothetical protein
MPYRKNSVHNKEYKLMVFNLISIEINQSSDKLYIFIRCHKTQLVREKSRSNLLNNLNLITNFRNWTDSHSPAETINELELSSLYTYHSHEQTQQQSDDVRFGSRFMVHTRRNIGTAWWTNYTCRVRSNCCCSVCTKKKIDSVW